MSLRELFDQMQKAKVLADVSADQIAEEVESVGYHEQDVIKDNRFIPTIDFSDPANFAKYGSAEEYYDQAIKRIYKTYPYDGSLKERLEWENSSSYVDLYLYENRYPRTNGYATLSADGWGVLNGSMTSEGYGLPTTEEYISFYGGPHTNPNGMGDYSIQFTGSNYYHTASNRTDNLALDIADKGVTVEFWLKKDRFLDFNTLGDAQVTKKEVIFDLWNGEHSGSTGYGRFRIELTASHAPDVLGNTDGGFTVTLVSGTSGFQWANPLTGTVPVSGGARQAFTSASIADGNWHHYAFSFLSASTTALVQGTISRFYVDGVLNNEAVFSSSAPVENITGSMQARIGALVTAPSGGARLASWGEAGSGKLSASLDEFRYWKTQRSSKDIGRHWIDQVGGGTNSDPIPGNSSSLNLANTTLGVYYKFNEGITGTSSVDNTVLDFSGRVTNGSWTGYTSNSRNTGSAIVSASAAIKEFLDPIIYSFHPDVITLANELQGSGSYHDVNNNAALYNTMPTWVTEEDQEGSKNLHKLTQIMGSYLDSLHLQIEALNKLKDVQYPSGTNKPLTFANRLLESAGLISPEIFLDADIIEKLADRSEERLYEKSLVDVKNTIYQNIYNNLSFIYKSKGTEKSFRNLIRCFGVDEELIKFNMYANNIEYELQNNATSRVIPKRFVDFNRSSSVEATVFQSSSYISGSTNLTSGFAFTVEANVVFPPKLDRISKHFINKEFLTASIFGVHSSSHQHWDSTFAIQDAGNFQVVACRDELGSADAKFKLIRSGTAADGLSFLPLNETTEVNELTSSLFTDVYDNSNWNFVVRVRPEKYPYVGLVTGALGFTNGTKGNDYIVEFRGINMEGGVIVNEFSVSGNAYDMAAASRLAAVIPQAPLSGALFLTGSRRFFVGAHRNNFTGSLIHNSDVKVGSLRVWLDDINEKAQRAHAKNILDFGTYRTNENAFPFLPSASFGEVLSQDTLILNWDFNQNTGSNADGEFTVVDASSGSYVGGEPSLATDMYGAPNLGTDLSPGSSKFGWLGPILNRKHPGLGYGFAADDTKAIDKEFISISRQNLPESLQSEDMITVYDGTERDIFIRGTRPVNYSFAFEKSLYQSISEEIMNYFATIHDIHNLIGQPVNKRRQDYKLMAHARQKFFERVQNDTIDFDKFYEFYKWFDSSLSIMLQQLVPASADVAESVHTMIESHVLERNKYQFKAPMSDFKDPDPLAAGMAQAWLPLTLAPAAGGAAMADAAAPTGRIIPTDQDRMGGWLFKHAPVAEEIADELGKSVSSVDCTDLQKANYDWWKDSAIRTDTCFGGVTTINKYREILRNSTDEGVYPAVSGGFRREQTSIFRLSISEMPVIHGVNYHTSKRKDIIFSVTHPDGPLMDLDPSFNIPANIALAFGDEVEQLRPTLDVVYPDRKQRLGFKLNAKINRPGDDDYLTADGNNIAPFSLYSSSVETGYNHEIAHNFASGVMVTNLHSDTYGEFYEAPIQSPFTSHWVGGREYRHVELNKYDSDKSGPNNLDSPDDRPEGFKILCGIDFDLRPRPDWTTTGALGIVGPRYPEVDDIDTTTRRGDLQPNRPPYRYDRPKGNRYREVMAKRPVNIKNIQSTTGSSVLGNYTHNYEIIQSCGRTSNDPFWQDQSFDFAINPETTATRGRFPLTGNNLIEAGTSGRVAASNVSGALNYELPERTGSDSNKTIIVNRFISPAAPEVQSRGYLDPPHEEFSVYNNLNYRNLSVRGLIGFSMTSGSEETWTAMEAQDQGNHWRGLRTLLSLHSTRFGGDPVFTPTPDDLYGRGTKAHPHPDVSSNPSYHKIQRNTKLRLEFTNDPLTYYDALTNDVITASVQDNGWIQHPIPQSARQYHWVTSSLTASAVLFGYTELSAGLPTSMPLMSASGIAPHEISDESMPGIARDFVGLNLIVYEPISCSADPSGNMLGYNAAEVANNNVMVALRPTTHAGATAFVRFDNIASNFNALMLHRNGPYQYPMWKRIRTGEHPIARYQRERNILSVRSNPRIFSHQHGTTVVPVRSLQGNAAYRYTEQPIMSRYHPVLFLYNGVDVRVSWANNLDYFSNESLNNRLNLHKDIKLSPAYQWFKNKTLISNNSAIEYKERIYPREVNVYQNTTRARTQYLIDNIWDDLRINRTTTTLTTAMGHPTIKDSLDSASIWPLDGHANFRTTPPSLGIKDGAGELQSNSAWYGLSGNLDITASAVYASRIPVGYNGSRGENTVVGGDSAWNLTSSGRAPYRTYEDYCQYLRLIGKDHTIVPEFRISEHIEDYVDTAQENWLTDYDDVFDLTGSALSSSSEKNFYKHYGTAEFFKYFSVIDGDVNGRQWRGPGAEKNSTENTAIKRHKLRLEASAIKQFLPYKGFYPVERTLELATLFSKSYGDNVSGNYPAAFRAMLNPLFGPGILYNTIKSGIAVGSFVTYCTASEPSTQPDIANCGQAVDSAVGLDLPEGKFQYGNNSVLSGNSNKNASQNAYDFQRISFEALYRPREHLKAEAISGSELGKIYDCGLRSASLSGNSINVRAAAGSYLHNGTIWNGLGSKIYELAIDNWLCGVTEFFMQNQNLTTFQSVGENDFDPSGEGVTQGDKYAMTLTLYRTLDPVGTQSDVHATSYDYVDRSSFEMYERGSAFGPPFVLDRGDQLAEIPIGDSETGHSCSFAPHTPAYFNGTGTVNFVYTPSFTGKADLEDIFTNLEQVYDRSMEAGYYTDAIGYYFAQQVSESFNLKQRVPVFNSETGEEQPAWLIQSKFETPVLNFANAATVAPADPTNLTSDSGIISKGMWHQEGALITDSKAGIFAEISTPANVLALSVRNPKSLAKLVGFEEGKPKAIGKIKDKLTLSEAVIVVPFTVVKGRRQFYRLKTSTPEERRASYILNKYILPPKFDYLLNDVDPILFYDFEFTMDFTKEEVAQLWQNFLPSRVNNHDMECAIDPAQQISGCTIEDDELIHDIYNCSDTLEWLVFKAKKRCAKDYTRLIKKDLTSNLFAVPSNNDSKYSYNWPYDYFSLVELIKIDATAQYKNVAAGEREMLETQTLPEMAIPAQSMHDPAPPPAQSMHDPAGPAISKPSQTSGDSSLPVVSISQPFITGESARIKKISKKRDY